MNKPFYQRSTFWLLILSNVFSISEYFKDNLDGKSAVIASVISYSAYAISRGLKGINKKGK